MATSSVLQRLVQRVAQLLRLRGALLSLNTLKVLLKAYGVFAAVHFTLKTYSFLSFTSRSLKILKDVPAAGDDWTGKKLMANFHRLHDWRSDELAPFPNADLVRTGGPAVEVVCNSEEAVKWLLKDEFQVITKTAPQDDYLIYMLAEFLGGDGIFVLRHGRQTPALASEDSKWWMQRKTAAKIFTKNNFANLMGKVFETKAQRMVQVIGATADRADEPTAKVEDSRVDAQRLFFAFTMDSIQEIFFGRKVDTLDGAVDEYANAFDTAHASMMRYALTNIPLMIATCEFLPFPFGTIFGNHATNLTLRLHRHFHPAGREFEKAIATLSEHTERFAQEARVDPKLPERSDLLALFLQADNTKDLTNTELKAIILNFIIAGRDTSACLLTWLFFELARDENKHVQRKLVEEVDAVLGGKPPTLEDLTPTKMPYLTGVMYEALRLHPPVPEDMKTNTEDVDFKGQRIPKGTRLLFIPYTIGRNPDKFPDPLKFDPERWIPFVQPSDFAFPVFQAGNRFCLGRFMAQFEVKLLVATLLQNFTFKLQPGEEEKISYSVMITMSLVNDMDTGKKESNNLWLLPTRRTDAPATTTATAAM